MVKARFLPIRCIAQRRIPRQEAVDHTGCRTADETAARAGGQQGLRRAEQVSRGLRPSNGSSSRQVGKLYHRAPSGSRSGLWKPGQAGAPAPDFRVCRRILSHPPPGGGRKMVCLFPQARLESAIRLALAGYAACCRTGASKPHTRGRGTHTRGDTTNGNHHLSGLR